MLISAILIGFIVISAASTISEVQNRQFDTSSTSNIVHLLEKEAQKVDHSSEREVENYNTMVSDITGFNSNSVHWQSENCFNVTLSNSERRIELNCIG